MKKWLERIKKLGDMVLDGGTEVIFYVGVGFLFILVATSAVFLSGVAPEELPTLELGLLMKGPLPYLWCGLFGVFLATRVKEWVATSKGLWLTLKAHPEIKARLSAKLSRLWNTARGYTS